MATECKTCRWFNRPPWYQGDDDPDALGSCDWPADHLPYSLRYGNRERMFVAPCDGGKCPAHESADARPALPAPVAEEPHLGWLYHNEDTGTEWSEQHPVESGEVPDATEVRPATLENLKAELMASWVSLAEARDEIAARDLGLEGAR